MLELAAIRRVAAYSLLLSMRGLALNISVVTDSIQKNFASRGSFLKSAAPAALTIALVSAALLPLATGSLALSNPALAAAGLIGGIGQGLFAGSNGAL